ncbi:hypothetical protein [Sphingomonas sp.]|uniref:hypothetical protein n=1 Tax=Sphingomonas sp. TaxID=28214 RepID=UPI0025D391E0|nr:hypothetical protein [Sphingomonas sp.]
MRLLLLLILLAACQREETVAPPTAEEHQRLDDAESMLDNLANEEGPANASAPSGPSN